ncbi:hypothetical protein KC19_9G004000 [Ceratodon purpureus]|uniref:Uncharacterized protein n=1 Tax=Ceratodon purpureus TaxID=3225 RepID=A0A8T0GP18_CERPU|nr:hypothetical protein KC19_9G004000 [Ceratodon purpureus]
MPCHAMPQMNAIPQMCQGKGREGKSSRNVKQLTWTTIKATSKATRSEKEIEPAQRSRVEHSPAQHSTAENGAIFAMLAKQSDQDLTPPHPGGGPRLKGEGPRAKGQGASDAHRPSRQAGM